MFLHYHFPLLPFLQHWTTYISLECRGESSSEQECKVMMMRPTFSDGETRPYSSKKIRREQTGQKCKSTHVRHCCSRVRGANGIYANLTVKAVYRKTYCTTDDIRALERAGSMCWYGWITLSFANTKLLDYTLSGTLSLSVSRGNKRGHSEPSFICRQLCLKSSAL